MSPFHAINRYDDPLFASCTSSAIAAKITTTFFAKRSVIKSPALALSASVATVNTKLCASHVAGSITAQEGDRAHKVGRTTHLALRDQAGPLLTKLGVLVQDVLGEGGKHVTGLNAVDTDTGVGPLNSKGTAEVTDCGLGCVVGSLRLRDVDNGTRHAADEDHASRALALHQVTGDTSGEEVGAINVDTPQLLDTLVRVGDCVKVLGEACGGDEVVNLAVLGNDLLDDSADTIGVGNW